MSQSLDYLRSIYRWEPETGIFTIDIRLTDYSRAFSSWSHAWEAVPEVAPGLLQYLTECSEDIPPSEPIAIVFGINGPRDSELENQLIKSIGNYFRYKMFTEQRRLQQLFGQAAVLVVISMALIAASIFLSPLAAGRLITATINQGLYVGGWVFLWEAIHLSSFRRSAVRQSVSHYRRFLGCSISFKSTGQE